MPKKLIALTIISLILLLVLVVILSQLQYLLGTRGIIRPEPGTTITVPVTGYAPSPYQTDATPCITAAGTRVRHGTVATNFLPLGTLLEIDDQVYIVEDRTNPRYYNTVDIFFASTSEALEFGRQKVAITVLDYGQPGQPLPEIREETPSSAETSEGKPEEAGTSVFEKIRGQFHHLRHLIRAGLPADVNRYDVDCFSDQSTGNS